MSATWPLPAGDKLNVAMAFDEPDHRLFVTTRNPGKLIVLNSDSGKVIISVPAVGMVDDMSYDAQHKRLYLAGDGLWTFSNRKIPIITLCWRRFQEPSAQRRAFWCRN